MDDTLKFVLFGSLPAESRYDTKALFLTNTYLDRILFSVAIPPPFYLYTCRHGIVEPIIDGNAVQRLSVIKDSEPEPQESHYRLPRDWTLQLNIRFRPFLDDGNCHPMDTIIQRDLVVAFQDKYEQVCDY